MSLWPEELRRSFCSWIRNVFNFQPSSRWQYSIFTMIQGKISKRATFPDVLSFTSEDLEQPKGLEVEWPECKRIYQMFLTLRINRYSIYDMMFLLFWVHLPLYISKHSDVSLFFTPFLSKFAFLCSQKFNVPQPNKMQECEAKRSGEEPSVAILYKHCQRLARNRQVLRFHVSAQ